MAIQTAIFGAGCFWGIEELFRSIEGVNSTCVGYAGGNIKNPTYKKVCSGLTNHAEVVKVIFNNQIIQYTQLLNIFWNCHNPTLLNRQGQNIGTQYRSIILYINSSQKLEAIKSKEKNQKKFNDKIITQILPLKQFYIAEDYHQKYLKKNGKGQCNI